MTEFVINSCKRFYYSQEALQKVDKSPRDQKGHFTILYEDVYQKHIVTKHIYPFVGDMTARDSAIRSKKR